MSLFPALFSRVSLEEARRKEDQRNGPQLTRALTTRSLIFIGVGNAIGAGIFVLTGTAAAQHAGPAIALAYLIAGLVCLLTSYCYSEAAALIPSSGGSYSYARVALGRLPAWLIGWCMIFEYLVAGSTVAVGWSAYAQALLESFNLHLPETLAQAPLGVGSSGELRATGALVDLPAVLLVLFCTYVLTQGVRGSSRVNMGMVLIKLGVIVLVVGVGAFYVAPENWSPFIPEPDAAGRYGWSGVLAASAIAFFSYSGFEAMSTSAWETRDPARTLPRALIAALAICAALYVSMALVMTGLVPFAQLDTPSPIATALSSVNLYWLTLVVNVGTVLGLGAATLVSLYGQSRVSYAMARDGEAPAVFAKVDTRHATPLRGTVLIGIVAATIAGLVPISLLGELVSLGCLIAFASVCVSVIALRRSQPQAVRPFRVPLYPWVPAAGALSCIGLMFSIPHKTWQYMIVWLALGLALFLGRTWWRKRAAV